jgi:hypothetical protein
MRQWTGFIWQRIRTSGIGPCKHGIEPLGSIQGREFLDWLSNYLLLNEDSAAWSWSQSRIGILIVKYLKSVSGIKSEMCEK